MLLVNTVIYSHFIYGCYFRLFRSIVLDFIVLKDECEQQDFPNGDVQEPHTDDEEVTKKSKRKR